MGVLWYSKLMRKMLSDIKITQPCTLIYGAIAPLLVSVIMTFIWPFVWFQYPAGRPSRHVYVIPQSCVDWSSGYSTQRVRMKRFSVTIDVPESSAWAQGRKEGRTALGNQSRMVALSAGDTLFCDLCFPFHLSLQICKKSRRIGCVIPHCKLQRGITQPILCFLGQF